MKIIKEGQIVFHEKYQISDEAKDFITKVKPKTNFLATGKRSQPKTWIKR